MSLESKPEKISLEEPLKEPWQAEALATAFSLQEAGLITATEWSDALGAAIKAAQADGDPDDGSTYYHHVLAALEYLLTEKDLVPAGELTAKKEAWEDAYRRTPHGKPVTLGK
ncbi:MAG: nitrile hydratase accessory protein [Pseudomonadota bacterium]